MWMGNEATAMRDIHFKAGRLPGRAVISVTGPEAAHFLHNLLAAEIEHLGAGDAAYAALKEGVLQTGATIGTELVR